MDLNAEQLHLLQSWNESKLALKQWQEKESALRLEVVKTIFNASDDGTQTREMPNGWKVKVTNKLDYNLDNKEGEVVALCAQIGDDWAKRLIRWTPELAVGAYKKLDVETQKIFDGCLTIKPAKPTVELVPPKQD